MTPTLLKSVWPWPGGMLSIPKVEIEMKDCWWPNWGSKFSIKYTRSVVV